MNANQWHESLETAPVRNAGGRPPKDHRGRQRKMLCGSCGFIAYASAGALEKAGGLPSCACGATMVLPNLRDRAVVEWDALAVELARVPGAYEAAMRELGYDDMRVRVSKYGKGGARQTRCQASGCHKFAAGRYCPEHEHERPAMGSTYKGRG